MSGDVVARASRLTAGVDSGQWDVVREQGKFYGVYQGEFGRRIAGLIYDRREAEFIAAARTLVPELVDEIERKSAQLAEWIAQYQDREAEVEKLRGALETIRGGITSLGALDAIANPSKMLRTLIDTLEIIERAGIEP